MKKLLLVFILPFTLFSHQIFEQNLSEDKLSFDEEIISILVLPAVDNTTSAKASELFSFTITSFLAEKGYYVFSPSLVDEFLKSENISDAKIARQIPFEKLSEIFDADAVLLVDINKWDTEYKVVSSEVCVELKYTLISLRSKKIIWQKIASASSVSKSDIRGGNLAEIGITLLFSLTSAAINTASDYQKLALKANYDVYLSMPLGKYYEKFLKDVHEDTNQTKFVLDQNNTF